MIIQLTLINIRIQALPLLLWSMMRLLKLLINMVKSL